MRYVPCIVRLAQGAVREWLRSARLDLALGACGVALGLPSLLYPFGRDQGLYFYVAREWVQHGSIPYRDVLDHKTPGIYVLHALAIVLFGPHQWGIRVLDLLGVAVFGALAGSLHAPAGQPAARGLRGGTVALYAFLTYGFLDFWNSAQSELWYAGFGVASVWAATRIVRLPRASFVAGVLAGVAVVMKPPSVWFVLVAVAMIGVRVRRAGSLRALIPEALRFGVGAALWPVLVVGYFASQHALFAMQDIVVGANAYYVKHESGAPPGFDWKDYAGTILTYYAPFTVLFPLGAALAWLRPIAARDRMRRTLMLATALLVAGTLAVVMQGKYYLLHWAACCLPFAHLGVLGLQGFTRSLPRRAKLPGAVALVAVGYVMTAWIPHNGVAKAQSMVWAAELDYLRGNTSRAELDAHFAVPGAEFFYARSRQVGDWLREHTTAADNITVRGFQPEIYAIAERRHIGRFFWTTFLTADARKYHREEWRAEDLRDLQEHPPKYVVALTDIHDGPDSCEWLATLGYRTVVEMGEFTIMGR